MATHGASRLSISPAAMASPQLARRLSMGTKGGVRQRALSVNSNYHSFSYGDHDDEGESSSFFGGSSDVKDDGQTKSQIELLRLRTKAFLAYSIYGQIYEWVLLLLSIASCLLFVYQTYLQFDGVGIHFDTLNDRLNVLELILAGIFSIDFGISLFIADHRLEFVGSFYSIVDILTVIPTWATIYTTKPFYYSINSIDAVIVYALYGLKTTRILRPLRIRRKLQNIEEEVQRCLADMVLRLLIMILFNTGVIQYLEHHKQQFDFHEWMYFLWITTSTVGYGDISAVTTLGRIAIMSIICFSIVVIPQMTNELLAKMSRSSKYARAVYHPKQNSRHIIICGNLSSTSLSELFEEIFHEDHENTNLYSVVLHAERMSVAMKDILKDPRYLSTIIYLEGTALFDRDLRRACAETCIACLVFTNKFTNEPDQEDAKSILQHYNIKRYIEHHRGYDHANRHVTFCVQLVRPENRRHFHTHDVHMESSTEHVICLNEIKMGIIAKSVLFPGTAALLMNLLASFADDGDEEEETNNDPEFSHGRSGDSMDQSSSNWDLGTPGAGLMHAVSNPKLFGSLSERTKNSRTVTTRAPRSSRQKQKRNSISVPSMIIKASFNLSGDADEDNYDDEEEDDSMAWMKDYQQGCGWEIYTTDIADAFEGVIFQDFAYALYCKLGIVLIGLQIEDLRTNTKEAADIAKAAGMLPMNHLRTLINPAGYKFPDPDHYKLRGLVIAQNQSTANLGNVENNDTFASMTRKMFSLESIDRQSSKMRSSSFSMLGKRGASDNSISIQLTNSSFLPEKSMIFSTQFSNNHLGKLQQGIKQHQVKAAAQTGVGHGNKIVPVDGSGNPAHNLASAMANAANNAKEQAPKDVRMKNEEIHQRLLRGEAVDDIEVEDAVASVHDLKFEAARKVRKAKLMDKVEKIRRSGASLQEKMYKIEQEFLRANYYMRDVEIGTMCRQPEVTIQTSVVEEVPHIHNHIIITGNGISNIFDLIKPLRAKELGPMRYIVILYPYDIPYAVWQRVSVFDGILLVKGTPLEEEDIRRAGIYRAQSIVILAGTADAETTEKTEVENDELDEDAAIANVAGLDALLDSDTIFTYKAVKRMNDSIECIVEFVKDNNINYLNPEVGLINTVGSDYKNSPQFAAGELFASSMLDTVVCQAFYNPHIINIINRLICSKDQHELASTTAMEADREGGVKIHGLDAIAGSSLYQLDVPFLLQHRTYGFLFKQLVKQGIIPIGLYRGVLPPYSEGCRHNNLPYVHTNPPTETELFSNDKVFVLSTKPLRSSKIMSEKDQALDDLMEEEMDKVLHNSKKNLRDEAQETALQRWRLLISRFENSYASEYMDYIHLLKIFNDQIEACKKRIESVPEDEPLRMGSPSDSESDSDSDSDSESESESEEDGEKSDEGAGDGSDDGGSDSEGNNSENRDRVQELGVVSSNRDDKNSGNLSVVNADEGLLFDEAAPRYIKAASKRVVKELGSSTRLTKFVIELFLPSIKIMIDALENKNYRIIKIQSERFALRAETDGFYRLSCWYSTLRDIMDVIIITGKEVFKIKHSNGGSVDDSSALNPSKMLRAGGGVGHGIDPRLFGTRFGKSGAGGPGSKWKKRSPARRSAAAAATRGTDAVMEFEDDLLEEEDEDDEDDFDDDDDMDGVESRSNSKHSKASDKDHGTAVPKMLRQRAGAPAAGGAESAAGGASVVHTEPVIPLLANRMDMSDVFVSEKGRDLLSDTIDAIEIAIWEAAVVEFL